MASGLDQGMDDISSHDADIKKLRRGPGSIAFGLERIAFAFLAQYGLDPQNWPMDVREAL